MMIISEIYTFFFPFFCRKVVRAVKFDGIAD